MKIILYIVAVVLWSAFIYALVAMRLNQWECFYWSRKAWFCYLFTGPVIGAIGTMLPTDPKYIKP